MRYGWLFDPWSGSLDELVADTRFAHEVGMDSCWLAQIWRFDALTLIPHLAAQAPDIDFGTSVVASYLRHPMTLASQALTANQLIGGRLALGIGVMHEPVILGPQMLRICGQRTAGTILANTGPNTIAEHIKPELDAAARAAGRPEPRIVGGPMGVHVTCDLDGARTRARRKVGF
jgi:alkanesulfonate monooxygenase SsuD/methylene tetrahydromethanopterin reductase-like flavin-dependent oxidoreductase (luciferase family)